MIISDIKEFFSFLRPSNIKGWFDVENLFVNYFWLTSIGALITLIFHIEWIINYIFPIIIYILCIRSFNSTLSFNLIDVLWMTGFLWIIITWIFNDYPHKSFLTFKAFTQELAYMAAYWISRNGNKDYVKIIIRKSFKPLLIACLIGIYCFYFPPNWYQDITDKAVEYLTGSANYSKDSMLELYRLRSFYVSPYYLSYFCAIVLIYEFFVIFGVVKNQIKGFFYYFFFILILLITDILCMMRAPVVSVLIGFFFAYLYTIIFFKQSGSTRKVVAILSFFIIIFLMLIPYLDMSIIEFMNDKIDVLTDDDENFILKRFYLQEQSNTLFGEGYGRYSRLANYMFNMPSIPDGEYMKIIGEQGYVGLIITVFLYGIGWVKALYNSKKLFFEFCLISMLFICMVGANPLSMWDKHCILFWLALGQISSYKNNFYGKNKDNSNVFATISSDTRER